MRIGYDASPIRPFPSGVGHYCASLLEAMCCRFPENEYLYYSHLDSKAYSWPGLLYTQKRSFPVKELWMQFWLPRVIARTSPDLCHFTNSIAPLRCRAPYILTVHDLGLITHPEWHPATRRMWMRRIMLPSIRGARLVVCDSEATRNDVLSWIPAAAGRLSVVPLAPRAPFLMMWSARDRESILARYGIRRPFLLYVGNIEPRKNLLMLLEAYRRLDPPEVDLVFAGKQAWLAADFRREIRKPCYAGKLHLLDYVPEKLLPALYQSALAFVYPSRLEGFGLPVAEAMASGTPVLASSIEPLASLVGDAGWLAHPDRVEEWVSALADIIGSKERRRLLGLLAKERARSTDWTSVAEQTVACYREALR